MEKSNYNMTISILGASFSLIMGILGIIFHSIFHQTLGIVFCSIYTLFLILYYIFQSISFSDDDKIVSYRLSKVFCSIATTFVTIYFILLFPFFYKWILLGFVLFFLVFEILLDSIGKCLEIKYLISTMKLFLVIFLLFYLSTSFLLLIGIFSVCLFYFSNLLGEVLKNKIIISYSVLSIIIFSIYTIFL